MKGWLLFALSLGLLCVLLLGSLPPVLKLPLLLLDIIGFLAAAAFAAVQLHPVPGRVQLAPFRPAPLEEGLPWIPRTVQEVLDTMDDEQFEYFAAAVIVGLREGYRFERRCGGPGDQGVDVRMRNSYGLLVVAQCKRFTPPNTVPSKDLREFWGAIGMHGAISGFFVTTSTFTPDAQQVIRAYSGRIRAIDGAHLDAYLQWRRREIALAYREVLEVAGSVQEV
jgi:hypothetical protein